jgi:phospholipid/cholesterol/gamma-HCH transport system permease protein
MTTTERRPADHNADRTEFDSPDADWTVLGPGTLLSKGRGILETAGDITRFSFEALRTIPKLRLYPSEVFRQAAILIVSSGFIVWLMEFVIGLQCGLEGNYTLKQIGAPGYSGIFSAWCAIREMAPYMWGYILAAKVGCGLVAEIGSMRISEEIDALEVIGVRPMPYIVASRIVAAWIALPFLYIVGLGVMYFAEWLVVVKQLGEVSNGGYLLTFWLFQNPTDFLYSLMKIMAMGTIIVFVGCYYGYKASGGPVGVGWNTAKSMMLNMVLVHVIGMFGTQLFWGLSPNAPIAN